MSSFTGRRGPNVSQYIANLNSVEPQPSDDVSPHDDLALFATTEFFDFDMSNDLASGAGDFGGNFTARKSGTAWQESANSTAPDFLNCKFALTFSSQSWFSPTSFHINFVIILFALFSAKISAVFRNHLRTAIFTPGAQVASPTAALA